MVQFIIESVYMSQGPRRRKEKPYLNRGNSTYNFRAEAYQSIPRIVYCAKQVVTRLRYIVPLSKSERMAREWEVRREGGSKEANEGIDGG